MASAIALGVLGIVSGRSRNDAKTLRIVLVTAGRPYFSKSETSGPARNSASSEGRDFSGLLLYLGAMGPMRSFGQLANYALKLNFLLWCSIFYVLKIGRLAHG